MTFTIMAVDRERSQVGIALATVSLAVGFRSRWVTSDGAIVSMQAFTNARVGHRGVQLLEEGRPFEAVVRELERGDSNFSYRQFGVMRPSGAADVYTGANTRKWAGHRVADDHLVMGNLLDGPHVLDAMSKGFRGGSGDLSDRLMLAIEAGRDAGGQGHTDDGVKVPELSAALRVHSNPGWPDMDLRVDLHLQAVAELRRVLDTYRPFLADYAVRAERPSEYLAMPARWRGLLKDGA